MIKPIKNLEMVERAETRAARLLRQILGKEQAENYRKFGYVEVQGNASGQIYRVRCRGAVRFWEGTVERRYCVFPASDFAHAPLLGSISKWPKADRVLTMAMWVKGNEEEFLEIAKMQRF